MTRESVTETVLTREQTGLWYLGQEGFLIGRQGSYIGVDLYLSNYVDQNCCQFVRWKRNYPAPIEAQALDFLEAVLCTHTHFDHADPWTLPKVAAAKEHTKFIVPAPEVDTVAGYGISKERIIPAYAGVSISIGGFSITPVPAAHEVLHTDAQGNYRELGYIIDDGMNRIFHGGDMCMYDGLTEKLSCIDVAILPVNGRDYFRNANDIIGNLDCREAVTLAKLIGADLLIPVHHDLYEVNKAEPEAFVAAVTELNRTQKYHIFVPGERYIYMR